ncbi:MAG: threonine aldolase [Bdellovibrionales bacterium]|nr:threonine aldolase [Bdellovibrionales bacterium]
MPFQNRAQSLVKSLASDNASGVHPDFLAAISEVAEGHRVSYGQDEITSAAIALIRQEFGTPNADVFFVFNGTAANVIALGGLTDRHEAVICSDVAHLHVDECGAPEKVLGLKLIPVPHTGGKIRIRELEKCVVRQGDQHYSQPRVVSLTQPTELGTCYSLDEIRQIVSWCHARQLKVHLDGSRIANACVTLGVTFKEMMATGVDAVSLGGTKNGMLGAEAVVFPKGGLAERVKFLRKFTMQLASKQRFMSVQFQKYFENELWKMIGTHVCRLARRLEQGVASIPEVEVTQVVQSNAVFARIPKWAVGPLKKECFFYVWDETTTEVRWMVSYDWTESDVDLFVEHVRRVCAAGPVK